MKESRSRHWQGGHSPAASLARKAYSMPTPSRTVEEGDTAPHIRPDAPSPTGGVWGGGEGTTRARGATRRAGRRVGAGAAVERKPRASEATADGADGDRSRRRAAVPAIRATQRALHRFSPSRQIMPLHSPSRSCLPSAC